MGRTERLDDAEHAVCPDRHLNRLQQCRAALAGVDDEGNAIHPGMFDAGIVSLANGDGTRRPPAEAIAAGVSALLDPLSCPLDDYLFLQSFEPLERDVAMGFLRGGIPSHVARNICVDCGTTRLFGAFLQCVAQPGDVFLAAPTFYHSLPDWCDRFGVTLACVPALLHTGYKLTVEALEAWYKAHVESGLIPKPKGLFLFNPTQTGAVYEPGELAKLAEFIEKADLMVLADHVFSDTEFPGSDRAAYLAAQPGMAGRVVTVDGVSKSHNLANIRVGWACGPKDIIDAMRAYGVSTIISVSRLSLIMARAALNAPAEYLETNAREGARRAAIIARALEHWTAAVRALPGAHEAAKHRFELVHYPQAGHSLLVTCRPLLGLRYAHGVIRNSLDVTRFFLSDAGVAVSPGYSSGLDGCEVRLCFGSVGLATTYAHSAARERAAAARCFESLVPQTEAPAEDRACHRSASVLEHAESSDPFEAGRNQLQAALMERMLPAILRLIQANSAVAATPPAAQQRDGAV